MLKKLQKYLLLHYPLLWNTRVVPALLGSILVNVLFFGIGYLTTFIDTDSYYSIHSRPFAYFTIALCIVAGFILWFVYYRKNNAFAVFYPKKSRGLYAEWVLVFIILFSMMMLPASFMQGINTKVKSYATQEEVAKAVKTINQVKYLIPSNKNDYFLEYPEGYTKNEKGQIVKIEQGENDNYSRYNSYETSQIDSIVESTNNVLNLKEHPNFRQLSLLNQDLSVEISNYDDYYSYYDYPDDSVRYLKHYADQIEMKEWLIHENKAAIEGVINDFLDLAKKYNFHTNLTKDKWMTLIYNPPTYPVSDNNLIYQNIIDEHSYEPSYQYYVPFGEVSRVYSTIHRAYADHDNLEVLLIVMSCLAGILSLLVFSARCSPGKSWLIAAIALAIMIFISGLLSVGWEISDMGDEEVGLTLLFLAWIGIFVGELVYVIRRIRAKQNKSVSTIIIHQLIWFLPFVPMLLLGIIMLWAHNGHHYHDYIDENIRYCIRCHVENFVKDHFIAILWANIALTFISMWFFISGVLRKWKALPEK